MTFCIILSREIPHSTTLFDWKTLFYYITKYSGPLPWILSFSRLGWGDQTVWSATWMGAWVAFGIDKQLKSTRTQPVGCPQTYNGHGYCMSVKRRITHVCFRLWAGQIGDWTFSAPNEDFCLWIVHKSQTREMMQESMTPRGRSRWMCCFSAMHE